MSKLLIFIGEDVGFDVERTRHMISEIPGVNSERFGKFIGAVYECEYTFDHEATIVRISDSEETITIEGLGLASINFALELQARFPEPLRMIDMDYSFDLRISGYKSASQLRDAIRNKNFSEN